MEDARKHAEERARLRALSATFSSERNRDEAPMAGSNDKEVATTRTGAASKIGDCREEVTFPLLSSSSSMLKMEISEKVYLSIDGDLFAKKGFENSVDSWVLEKFWK
ncbi:hypothetical protein Fot_35062 [Forsythia ovata]|uniref:Uncharacterized protein n=1 Tax=Forsythia ovata TaxID=205694 RepID=A0ABD1SKG1_9LAMI